MFHRTFSWFSRFIAMRLMGFLKRNHFDTERIVYTLEVHLRAFKTLFRSNLFAFFNVFQTKRCMHVILGEINLKLKNTLKFKKKRSNALGKILLEPNWAWQKQDIFVNIFFLSKHNLVTTFLFNPFLFSNLNIVEFISSIYRWIYFCINHHTMSLNSDYSEQRTEC